MPYVTPPTFATGERLSAYKLRLLAANDDHHEGVADALRAIPATMGRSFIGGEPNIVIFDGYLYLTQNTLKYALYLSANDDSQHIHLWFDYGGAGQVELTNPATGYATAGEQALQTYDATAFTKNALYRVYAVLYRATTGTAEGELRKFYEVYSGALTFTAPNAFTDGNVSAAAHFQALADNDAYFRALEDANCPSIGLPRSLAASTTTMIWRGWVKHKNDKIGYRLQMAASMGWAFGGTMTLKYGVGDALVETVATVNTETISEGTHTLANAFVVDTWYKVEVEVVVGADVACVATVHYIEEGAAAVDAAFTPLGEFRAGQFGWGTTANQRSRFALLGANDTALNARVNSIISHAVKKALYLSLGSDVGSVYAIRRRQNVLYYRGKNLTMTWGDGNSMTLNDYDGSHPFWTLDLGGVSNLAPGQVYYITSSSKEAEFAQERLE